MTTNDRIFIVACMVCTVGACVAIVAFLRPEPPVINMEPPGVHIDAVELAEAMTMPRYERDPNTGQIMGWPDNTGVEEGQFLEDCRDVCSSPGIGSLRADGSIDPPPRVLYTNFDHMVCVCFDGDRVRRYVGWQRR